MNTRVEVRGGIYRDSVTLLRVSRALAQRPGVTAATVAMATGLNLDLLVQQGFTVPAGAGPNDLVVAIRGEDEAAVRAAWEALDGLLAEAPAPAAAGGAPEAVPARTTGAAARRLADPGGGLALVSVPGRYAFAEAMDALAAGLNVMVFSDNVPLHQEIALKEAAGRRGLIVMGPDCGTAMIGGVGLGFANAVRPGPVGIVAASGTGAQQMMCLLDTAGVGVRHVLGVGGRDLSAEVSGRSTLAALAALDADPATEMIAVVTKPPASRVADLVHSAARRLDTPVTFAMLGEDAADLTDATAKVLRALGRDVPRWPSWPAPPPPGPPSPGALRGLFAGGTLCAEAALVARRELGPDPVSGHAFTDFGDDEYTRGRAHPMIDPTLRLERLAAEAADPACAVVLMDVVLGYGADPDPAALLAPAIEDALARRPDLRVVVSLCGTPADPQDRDRQAAALQAAGADVFASNAEAARHAARLARGRAAAAAHGRHLEGA
ncbi:FdrA family protein [Thermomonospora cellulosilytica]|uniref:FdrA protein n=1 Tax=Thermomonospora cellulosilytica TaxID=1411118 RepID=A0A7W3RB40_9ACTN|nr:FdrA family protein [Thermomonospora cellulosilytica]MBA9006557.1 FdrA protein [Thermomonospora cellulosilytica]